ncbi:hypothetical protein GCM10010170_052330 [Dactylosporangium salmoneum]|uniref:Uncharacterized protein n=1 Tax=Dactylosporangium salmoneum TaxID=53361 RepID=A0ABP5TRT2_9ACTN
MAIRLVLTGDDSGGAEVDGLLSRSASAVDGRARHLLRPAGGEQCHPADVARLVSHLADAPPDDVVDVGRGDAATLDESGQDDRGQIGRMSSGQ